MARLTTKQYLHTHDRLRRLWLHDPRVYAELTSREQWDVYAFFAPHREMSTLELLTHRDSVTAKDPSLPQRAGRAVKRFWEVAGAFGVLRVQGAPAGSGSRRKQRERRLVVKTQVRPEIDAHKLARAFIGLAYQRMRKQARKSGQELRPGRADPEESPQPR